MSLQQSFLVSGLLALLFVPWEARGEQPTEVSSVDKRVVAAQPGDTIFFVIGSQMYEARVNRAALLGRVVRLQRSGSKVRGRVASDDVEMSLGASQITGKIAGRPIVLDVSRNEDATLVVAGRFGARAVSLQISVRAMSGDVGPCRYDLQFRRNQYAGHVACGGEPTPVRLQVPVALAARGDVELASMMTAFLAR